MEHREGKEAQHVTVVVLDDCHFLFPKMKKREKKNNNKKFD
jgi:hypothetical protein